ncbi:MAG: hypothetical protein RL220_1530 [Bacteroidota bacterium]
MAGMGKRLRPHTLTTPKPLLHVAGKPIVQRLVEDIVAVAHQKVEEIAFVTGRFGEEAEKQLIAVAESLGAKGSIHYQDIPLGTAHAILCAESVLDGPVTVAFADTLFRASFEMDSDCDGVLWVQKIDDPRQFGVVIVDDNNVITEFREKPQEFVSDMAMIGIYYFADGAWLRDELNYLVDNNIMNSGEYQLPDALRNMVRKGARFKPGAVLDWMDCGNKDAVLDTNRKVLEYTLGSDNNIGANVTMENSSVIAPCFIGDDVIIRNSVVGPFVSMGQGSTVADSKIEGSVFMGQAKVERSDLRSSMAGVQTTVINTSGEVNLGDYSSVKGS